MKGEPPPQQRRKRPVEMSLMPIAPAGPFVSVLLSRLENMHSNTLHVNLLLTGILAQLAAYPQPLLRSFLLNTNLVFQPTVRSLYQVKPRGGAFSVLSYLRRVRMKARKAEDLCLVASLKDVETSAVHLFR